MQRFKKVDSMMDIINCLCILCVLEVIRTNWSTKSDDTIVDVVVCVGVGGIVAVGSVGVLVSVVAVGSRRENGIDII